MYYVRVWHLVSLELTGLLNTVPPVVCCTHFVLLSGTYRAGRNKLLKYSYSEFCFFFNFSPSAQALL